MMLLIIFLLLSAGLNLILIFLLVKKYDEAKLNIIPAEGPDGEAIEYFELNKSHPLLY